jgi:predicted lipoprotein
MWDALVRPGVLMLLMFLAPTNGFSQTHAETREDARQMFLQGVYRSHFAPRTIQFKQTTRNLQTAVEAMCGAESTATLDGARHAWVDAMLAWESLGVVGVGPLLKRHTAANIDFWPTRPNMIEAAMRSPPADARALRKLSVAARGLPALEWLLWTPGPHAPANVEKSCRYSQVLAKDLADEAEALELEFAKLAAKAPAGAEASKLLAECVNQSVAAIEDLRRKRLLNPLTIRTSTAYARSLSQQAQPAIVVQWDAIQDLLIGDNKGSLSALLEGSDLPTAAAHLQAKARESDTALRAVVLSDPVSVRRAAEALMGLRRSIETEIAPALGITISFSDFDGD